MLRTLFHIPTQIGEVPLFGFGVFFWLWCAGAILFLVLQWKKQGWNRELSSSLLFLVVVGLVIAFILPAVTKPEGIPVRGYGTMLFIAIVSSTALCIFRGRSRGYSPDTVISFVFWLCVCGIIGARVFYVVEYWEEFRERVLAGNVGVLFNVADGGIVVYGSLIGGLIGLVVFTRKHKLPFLATCDLIAPAMMLGLAIGRIGCLFNGCCYGGHCELPWAVTFPTNSPPYESQVERGEVYGFRVSGDPDRPPVVLDVRPGSPAGEAGLKKGDVIENLDGFAIRSCRDVSSVLRFQTYPKKAPVVITTAEGDEIKIPAVPVRPRSLPIHPTQLYSSLNAFAILLILLAVEGRLRREGELFCLMLVLYAPMRFILEIIRTDEAEALGTSFSISQNISIAVILGVVLFWWFYLRKTPPRKHRSVLARSEEVKVPTG